MKRALLLPVLALVVSSCGASGTPERDAKVIHDQIGRFSMVAASEGHPPLIFDSATGCVMAINKDETNDLNMSEVTFVGGTNNCEIMRQLPTADTMEYRAK